MLEEQRVEFDKNLLSKDRKIKNDSLTIHSANSVNKNKNFQSTFCVNGIDKAKGLQNLRANSYVIQPIGPPSKDKAVSGFAKKDSP